MKKDDSYIQKANGELVLFKRSKLISSMMRSGAKQHIAESISKVIEKDLINGMRTTKIYERAFKLLKLENRPAASTYRLKKAVMDLGPTGFPFEFLVGNIFREQGYQVQTGVILQGKCVFHEVDVLAQNEEEVRFIECKFHNQSGVKSDVKVALYVNSRVQDLKEKWFMDHPEDTRIIGGGLVTNTKLTEDARTFTRCSSMIGVGWDSPEKNGLLDKMKEFRLLPITLLNQFSKKEKQELLSEGIVLSRELLNSSDILKKLGYEENKITRINAEAKKLIDEYGF